MNRMFLILRHEFSRTIRRTGFIILTLALPVLALLAIGVFQIVSGIASPPAQVTRIRYVDEVGSFTQFTTQGNINLVRYDSQEAAKQAKPVILEPIMNVEVVIPEQFMGDITGSLSGKRGAIEGMEDRGMNKAVHAKVPLSEMFGYTTSLRSMTEGRGSMTMEFDHYEVVPTNVATDIIASRK